MLLLRDTEREKNNIVDRGSESGEVGSCRNATLVALVTNHLYKAIYPPVRTPAVERGREGEREE